MSSSQARPGENGGAVVQLYRYDLTQGMAAQMSPLLLGTYVEAVWHTAIVVFDREYYFDGGVGVVAEAPGATRFGRPHRRDMLGTTQVTASAFGAWVASMRRGGYGPNDYNLLQRNCNHFTQDASMFLLGIGIGEDIRNMIGRLLATPLGRMVRPMLESMTHSGGGVVPGDAGVQQVQQQLQPAANTPRVRQLLSRKQSLTADELEAIQLSMALLESSFEDSDGAAVTAFVLAMQTLDSVLQQVLQHPTEQKYRRVKTTSPTFQERILAKRPDIYGEAVATILTAAGFTTTTEADGVEYYQLEDANGSGAVLAAVSAELRGAVVRYEATATTSSSSPSLSTTTTNNNNNSAGAAITSQPIRVVWSNVRVGQSHNAAKKAWVPIGSEGGETLYSIRVNGSFMGKARAQWTATSSGDAQLSSIGGHYLGAPVSMPLRTSAVKEIACNSTDSTVDVLSLQSSADLSRMAWVPFWLLLSPIKGNEQPPPLGASAQRWASLGAVLTQDEGMLVMRARHGGGTHPAVAFPTSATSGNQRIGDAFDIRIPFGGSGVDVTATAEVLCDTDTLPDDIRQQLSTMHRNAQRIALKRQRVCAPLSSIDELLAWSAPPDEDYVAPRWLKQWTARPELPPGHGGGSDARPQQQPRLLVCHDFKGGYRLDDTSTFSTSAASCQSQRLINDAYTVHYWHHVDLFVYFSHARISIPPQDWIVCAHRHGVPVLGTFITEWEAGRAEWSAVLTDPQRMGSVINQLVEVADHFGFEGYMLNVENTIATQHIHRLVGFLKFLRQKLRDRLGAHRARVVWYDAVTTDGKLSFQNALNDHNKMFFDASDAIFINYFWQPSSLRQTELHVGNRRRDVFVGVDCFGRSTFGGGGFRCDVAVQEIDAVSQCVALFAPGWTLENASGGTREGFHVADARLWSSMEPRFFNRLAHVWYLPPPSSHGVDNTWFRPLVTGVFSRGTGDTFFWCGERLQGCGAWVQRAGCAPSSLPSGHRVVCGDKIASGEERWRLATFDPEQGGQVTGLTIWRDALLLSSSSCDRTPYFGDSFLALLPEMDGGRNGGRWAQLYATDLSLPTPSAAEDEEGQWCVELRIVWRWPRQHDHCVGGSTKDAAPRIRLVTTDPQHAVLEAPMLLTASSLNASTNVPSDGSYVVSSSTCASGGDEKTVAQWTSSMVCWRLSAEGRGDATTSAIVSVQLQCASSIDIGLLCVSAVRRQGAVMTTQRPASCTKVEVLVGASRGQGSLRLLWAVPTTPAATLVPVFLVGTLGLPGKPKLFLGQHEVPASTDRQARGNIVDAAMSLDVDPTPSRDRCFVDVDVDWTATVSSAGSLLCAASDMMDTIEAVDPHNPQDSTVIWTRTQQLPSAA